MKKNAELNLWIVKAGVASKESTQQVSVDAFVSMDSDPTDPCPDDEHLHVFIQTNEPILIRHIDLITPAMKAKRRWRRGNRLDDYLAIQDDMRAGDPFDQGLTFHVRSDRPMCAAAPLRLLPTDWCGRDVLVRCVDAACQRYYSEPFWLPVVTDRAAQPT